MPRLIPSLALTAAVVMSNAALEPRASAQVQETHSVYHTQFENDWVGVVRVRYPANSKTPLHGHPPTVTAYVYLSESWCVAGRAAAHRRAHEAPERAAVRP